MRHPARRVPAALRFGAVLVGVASAGVALPAGAAAALKVTKAGPAPVVLPSGAKVEVKASASGGSGKLSIVLATSATSAKGGVVLTGKGAKVRAKGAKNVAVKGTLPASLPAGEQRFVLVCASAAKAVAGKKASCKSAGRAPVSGGSLSERLDAARAAGRLTAGKQALYTLYALNRDPRLPAELVGATAGSEGTDELIRSVLAGAESFSKSERRALIPFLAPPSAPGSAWRQARTKKKPKRSVIVGKGARAAAGRAAVARAARAEADCTGYNMLKDSPYVGTYAKPWIAVPTSDGKALIWYQEGDNAAKGSAATYAAEFPGIWKKLTAEFGEPQSDKGTDCYAGPDGRFDVYVDNGLTWAAAGGVQARGSGHTLGVTMPYPAASGKFCTNRPAWITVKAGQPRFTLAHEFMHAIQFSHTYASCDEPLGWWDEGGANWAADFVYPGDNLERDFGDWATNPLANSDFVWSNYRGYPFWMFLQRTYGTGVLKSIFAQLKTKKALDAVNAAIPGGFAEQWPKFAVQLWNISPIGSPGFPIKESFDAWDRWPFHPAVPPSPDLVLDGAKEKTFELPIQNAKAAAEPLSVAAYHQVFVRDDDVREIKFTNKLKGSAPAHVQALLRLKTGEWKLKDWTGQDPVLCRDNPEEDVQELVIISTNAGPTGSIPSFTHELRGRDACERPTFRITAYAETMRSTTDRGLKETSHTFKGTPGDPVTVDPCPDGDCEPQAPSTQFEAQVATVSDMTVTGPPDEDSCPGGQFKYPTQRLDNPGRLTMVFDPRVDRGDATAIDGPPIASVGDVQFGFCGAYTTGTDTTDVTSTVPRDQVLSGQPFTFSFSRSATVTADPFADASPTISYAWSKTVTMVRVNEDGSPYGS